jgi:hypothetical protein
MRSLSTSAKPPRTASISLPVLVPVSAHGSASDRNCALASTIRFTMPNGSNVLRARSVDPRHRHHVAGGQLVEHAEKLAPVWPRTRYLFPVDVRLLHSAARSCSSWLSRVCP